MSVWDRVRAWLDTLSRPRTQAMTRASAWAVRGMLWRQRLHQRVAAAQQVWGRIEPALRLPFFALTTAIAPTRVGLTLDDYEYSPPSTARARIVANPTSGGAHSDAALRELAETARWLTERGLPTELRLTRDAGHATELAREAAVAGLEMVIAAGGDGTVNDVIQALAGYRTALGVLPTGTVNVWAREMGIGLNAVDAREILLYGARRRVDLGRAGQRYFLMMAGIGFDAEVARRVEQGRLKRFGLKLLEYLGAVLLLSVTHRPSSIRITMGQHKRHQQALMVIIGNTRLYGGALTFTRRAVADDGTLDVVVIGSGGMFHRISVIGRALLRLPAAGPRVRYERAQMLRLESKRPTLVQVDGEVIGYLPMTFSVAPQALSVIVPRDAPAGLFGRAPESASLNR
ncbi:MAG TPA: diacylglycerol kinase family protein [Ktedonobacterales bacterium]|nr:diacylglycerol kinase family protein [Ktedonobacterales bacterium]